MPRKTKGPRLYLRKARIDARNGQKIPDRWFIRDGSTEVGTGCGVERLAEAERQLACYIQSKWEKPLGDSDPSKVLIADVLALYSVERGASLRSDAATMQGFVKNLLLWWADRTLADIRRQTCQAYAEFRASQPIRHGETGRTVSVQTARRELEVLSAAIGYWDDEHHLVRRPKVILPEKSESLREALTRREAAALLYASLGHRKIDSRWITLSKSSRANRSHLRRFILIGLYTGSRAGVIKRLSWCESLDDPWVDLDAGMIYRRGRNERESRTKRRPVVKLPPRLLVHMRRWHRQDLESGATRVLHHGGEPIGSVRTGFTACVADAGLSEVTPHWLRHTAATWLMEWGVDLWLAAGFLGMSTQTLERHYGHHRPDHQSAARKAFR